MTQFEGHTPGPWHVAGQEQVQVRSSKHQIAKAWAFSGKTGQANARLIAAAPTLLDEVAQLRREIAALGATRAVGWRPISTVPMDGKPILGWCVHDADDYYDGESGRLTIYGAHCEGVSHVPDGAHVLEWGGAFDDSTWESPGPSLPDWWFRSGSGFEEVANPTHWMPIAGVTK